MTRRIVVTGMGAVTPFGDLAQSSTAIRERRSALAPVRSFDASSFAESRAGECSSFDARPWFRMPKALRLADRRTRLAVAAAGMAFADAHLDETPREDVGVIIGTSGSDVQVEDCARALGTPEEGDVRDIDYFGTRILRRLNPLWLLVNLANMASAHIAIQLEARGPNSTITTDWIAGVQAIGEAARWIGHGETSVVIAGGADCGVLPFVYASLEAAGFLGGADPCFVPGEGAAIFVLEDREHARKRGARIIAELTGYASANGDGALARATKRALAESGSTKVDLVCDTAPFMPRQPGAEGTMEHLDSPAQRRFECSSLVGHALAAASPTSLAIALTTVGPGRSLLVNALGALGQAASLAVTSGAIA